MIPFEMKLAFFLSHVIFSHCYNAHLKNKKMISHKFKLTFRIYFWHTFVRLFFLYEFHIHGQISFPLSNCLVLKIWQIILKLCNFFNSH